MIFNVIYVSENDITFYNASIHMNWLKLYIMSFFVTDFLVARQNSICYKVFSRAKMHSILKNYTSKIYKEYHFHFGDLLLNFIFISNAETPPVQA